MVFALVGGRRRTLTVDLALAFQLLARPQDRLVDLRFDPKDAEHPAARFYFPEQATPARVLAPGGGLLAAADVRVQVVDVAVPRLRRLLCDEALETFAGALEAGEAALAHGPVALLEIHVLSREVRLGDARVQVSHDQMVWLLALALARLGGTDDGWLDPTDTALLERAWRHCREVWRCPDDELSDAYDFRPEAAEHRRRRLNPIRSRLRAALRRGLAGHPHRVLVVPELVRTRGHSRERLAIPASRVALVPPIERG
jgi:hypothetical protein